VARQAGVSPAAPYHHFKDKGELLAAVADEGWTMLGGEMTEAMQAAPEGDQITLVLLAYVRFARTHPALYRVMFDAARNNENLPMLSHAPEGSPYAMVRENLTEAGARPDFADVELTIAATWSAAHGLAEMAGFKQFEHVKTTLGGEAPFLEAVLRRMQLRRILG
jgi:AcrR family transcriptional regulator